MGRLELKCQTTSFHGTRPVRNGSGCMRDPSPELAYSSLPAEEDAASGTDRGAAPGPVLTAPLEAGGGKPF